MEKITHSFAIAALAWDGAYTEIRYTNLALHHTLIIEAVRSYRNVLATHRFSVGSDGHTPGIANNNAIFTYAQSL